jgi:hypothetical protein
MLIGCPLGADSCEMEFWQASNDILTEAKYSEPSISGGFIPPPLIVS